MSQKLDVRQIKLPIAQSMIGNSANETLDSVIPKINAELAKLFEDRNLLLTGGGTASLDTASTSLSFTSDFTLYVNQNAAGAAPYAITLGVGNSPIAFTADGKMAYLVINRTAQTATFTSDATSLPAATSANQEVILIAKRVGTSVYFRNGFNLPAGGSAVIGRTGSVVDTEFSVNDVTDSTKKITFNAGGTTATSTSIQASQTANRTLTLPDVTDTLVARAAIETLSGKQVQYSSVNDSTTTGSNTTAQAFTTGIIRLTNASLVSLSGIPAGSSGQFLIIENKTGNQISINNEEITATAANRIQTGNGGNVSMPNNAAFMFTYDTTSSRWQLSGGSGSGSGGSGSKNYLSAVTTSQSATPNTGNGNFESGSTTGFSLGTVGTLTNGIPTGSPTFGSGASGNLSISVVNTNTLAGAYSLSYASSTATTQGNMLASDSFYIDNSDQGKVLSFKLSYKAQVNPTNANFSGTALNSFGVAVWDVTNSAWLNLAGNFNFTQNSGIGQCTGTFQTAINTTQLRFVFYNVNATAGAFTMYLDDIVVGPQTIVQGAAISDWQSYTPTFTSFGTVSTQSFFWRRHGDSINIRGKFTVGTVTSGTSQVSLPPGFTVDSTKNPSIRSVGTWFNSTTSTQHGGAILASPSASVFEFGPIGTFSNSSISAVTSATIAAVAGTGDVISLDLTIPIQGWSSNTTVSNDTDTRVVDGQFVNTGTQSVVQTTDTVLVYNSIKKDSHGAFNTSNNRYTIPVSGDYQLSAYFTTSSSSAAVAGGSLHLKARVNGTTTYVLALEGIGAQTAVRGIAGSTMIPNLKAGDYIEMLFYNDYGTTFTTIAGLSVFSINRLSGPATIAASETINMSYGSTAGSSIGASLTLQTFTAKEIDSHGGWNGTDTFTAPISGIYSVAAGILTAAVTLTTAQSATLAVYKNGVLYRFLSRVNGTGASNVYMLTGTDLIKLSAGETLQIYAVASVATAQNTAGANNKVTITRVGN